MKTRAEKIQDRIYIFFSVCISVALLILAIDRAIVIPLTHDEAFSFNSYAGKPVFDIIGYVDTYGMPNNHILNTLLMKLDATLFGSSTLSLRLPNLLAFCIYLFAGSRLLFSFRSKGLRFAGFLLLCFNPYLFDFFSLARGYGIANGLMLFSVLQLYRWWESPSSKRAVLLFVFSALTVLSNFSTLHFFLAVTVVFVFLNIKKQKPSSLKTWARSLAIPFVSILALGGILYEPFRCILKWKTTYGGTTGFWHDCVLPLIATTGYQAKWNELLLLILPLAVIAGLLFIVGISIFLLLKKRESFLPLLVLLLLLPVLLFQLQHLILGTEFPVSRTIQFVYPLFILALFFALDEIEKAKNMLTVFAAGIGLLFVFHFYKTIRTSSVMEWKEDASNREVLNDLQKQVDEMQSKRELHLGITWTFEPGLNYERSYRNLPWLSPLTRDGIESDYDFYYVSREDSLVLAQRGKVLLNYYPESRTSLFR